MPPTEHLSIRGFQIVRCEGCNHEWVAPQPTLEQIDAVYASGYFTGRGAGYADYFTRGRTSNQRKARHRLAVIERFRGKSAGSSLDVGAADGTFVEEARSAGLTAYGVEVSPEARAALSPEVAARVYGSLTDAETTGPYDMITLWDVLEHLPDISESITRIAGMLKPGGVLGVVVPVIDNWNARRKPHTWDQYKPPEHLTYFSTRSLRAFLTAFVGPVVYEEAAWVRYSRHTHPDLSGDKRHWSVVPRIEGFLARIAARLALVDQSLFLDSQLVLCQKR